MLIERAIAAPAPSRGFWTTRRLAWLIGSAGCLLRVAWAAASYGTNDVRYWTAFADGARAMGPIHLYSIDFPEAVYNHGPLTSWLLFGLTHLDLSVGLPFLIRLPSSLADLFTTVLVYELVRGVRGERSAIWSAGVFTVAPVTVIVAGFHGNTDSVLVCFVLLAIWALVHRGAGGLSGLAFGLAVSIKLVPVVLLPVLVVVAWRHGPRALGRFFVAGAAVFAALWVPVLVAEPKGFTDHVLGYAGTALPQWGLPELAHLSGADWSTVMAVGEDLRLVPVAVAALVPAILAARARSQEAMLAAVCSPLGLMLFLSTAYSMQYLVWPFALVLVALPLRIGAAYATASSAFALIVYSGWTGWPPWDWEEAHATLLPDPVVPLMFVTWLALGYCCYWALAAALAPANEGPRRRDDVVIGA